MKLKDSVINSMSIKMKNKKVFCPCCGTELVYIDYNNGDCIYYCKNCEEEMTNGCDFNEMKAKLQRIKHLENLKIDFWHNKLLFLDGVIPSSVVGQIEGLVVDHIDNDICELRNEIEYFDIE